MWNFSNELPIYENPSLVDMLNSYIRYIIEYTAQRWNRYVPVTVAVVDIPASYDNLMARLEVDVFSTNAGYRGYDFQVSETKIFQEIKITENYFEIS